MTGEATPPVRVPPAEEVFEDPQLCEAARAAERGDVAAIRALGPVDLNASSPSGASLLMYMIAKQSEAGVRALLEAGADPNALTKEGASPMMAAGISGDPRWLTMLLDKGGDANIRSAPKTGEPLLPLLVFYGQWESMLTLLDRGADIDATGPSGETAAFRLASLHQFDRVNALLDRGADPLRLAANGLTLRAFIGEPLLPNSPQEPWRQRVVERVGIDAPAPSNGDPEA